MRVILDTDRALHGAIQRIGDVIDVDDREGRALIDTGQAHIETAMLERKTETAVMRKGRGR